MFEDKKVKALNFQVYTRQGCIPDEGCSQRPFEVSWQVEKGEIVGQEDSPQKGDIIIRYTDNSLSYLYVTEVYETSDSWRARVHLDGYANLKGLSRLQM